MIIYFLFLRENKRTPERHQDEKQKTSNKTLVKPLGGVWSLDKKTDELSQKKREKTDELSLGKRSLIRKAECKRPGKILGRDIFVPLVLVIDWIG
jgi:hypothetical protein